MNEQDVIKKRQSEVTNEGRAKEEEVINILLGDKEIEEYFLIYKPSQNIPELNIDYTNHTESIDADIVIARRTDNKIVCVLSVKKSFRERGAQTAYWAVKIKQSKKDYKYILVTPDVDEELYNPNDPTRKRKWRVILSYECDAVFIYSKKGKVYKEDNFYVGDEYLIEYIKSFI